MHETDYLIVGAGISGLTAALTLLNKCPQAKVTILDSASEAGGLLRSVSYDDKSFDFGTHIPEMSSDSELNSLLFPADKCADWHRLTALKTGNYFAGKMNEQSQFLNVTYATDWFNKALYELLQTSAESQPSYPNLDVFSRLRYGQCVTEKVFSPLMTKFTGMALNELSSKAAAYYGMARLIYGDARCAANLKKIAAFDEVLAYPSDTQKPRQATWIYPSDGKGIGSWITLLTDNIRQLGGHFIFNCKIEAVSHQQGNLVIQTQAGQLTARQLIWTIPAYSGLQGGHQQRPASRAVAIYHFHSKTKPATSQHYLYCYDAAMHSYRITFYDNIQQHDSAACYRCSVEVIENDERIATVDDIKAELVTMGLFNHVDEIIHAGSISLPFGFPILKAGDEQSRAEIFAKVKHHNPEILFCGRGKPQVFFMTDVLLDTYQETLTLIPAVECHHD
ncbi:NAD(P)-binding protein [Arsukibacterium sp.]|uniref:NAD(P)-binding protein n=1 Tax=Arsukibacterium sp. TaxID=1977258 RepID=UPI00299CEA7A|nr:NAD(P)-binding protein [Arsukibacterium sp.]MDX1677256.1 FAD-dependent oxidoreductase [Arsukibacterium sp.]